MKVLVTGGARGLGLAISLYYLNLDIVRIIYIIFIIIKKVFIWITILILELLPVCDMISSDLLYSDISPFV